MRSIGAVRLQYHFRICKLHKDAWQNGLCAVSRNPRKLNKMIICKGLDVDQGDIWTSTMKNYLQMCVGVKKDLTELADLTVGLMLTLLGLD